MHIYIHVYMYIYIYQYIYTSIYMCLIIYLFIDEYNYLYVYIHTYLLYMYVHVHMYIPVHSEYLSINFKAISSKDKSAANLTAPDVRAHTDASSNMPSPQCSSHFLLKSCPRILRPQAKNSMPLHAAAILSSRKCSSLTEQAACSTSRTVGWYTRRAWCRFVCIENMSTTECMYIHRRKPPSLLVFRLGWFPNEESGGRGPPLKNDTNFLKIGVGIPLPPGSAFGNHPQRKPPRAEGFFLSICMQKIWVR